MTIDSKAIVSMSAANRNFSSVARMVDESGKAVIMRNNIPAYLVISINEYEELQAARQKMISEAADALIRENLPALLELAK